MTRDPRKDPQKGDVLNVASFGGLTKIKVVKRVDDDVAYLMHGRLHQNELKGWRSLARDAEVVTGEG